MQEIDSKIYPAKLLLFGEYSVIHGGDSLATPYEKKYAYWSYKPNHIDSRLSGFLDYLKSLHDLDLDLERFEVELEEGLYLKSNMPVGYGAGSSGSVVAAVYDRFSISSEIRDPSALKIIFSKMESFFHGSSSGLDPLVSYLDSGVYINKGEITTVQLSTNSILAKLFLFDTLESRSTGKLVSWYKTQLQEKEDFRDNIADEMTKLSSELIKQFLLQDEDKFESLFMNLSQLQSENLIPMFPSHIKDNLDRISSLTDGGFKLCGAGGGGYFLGYMPRFVADVIPNDLVKQISRIVK